MKFIFACLWMCILFATPSIVLGWTLIGTGPDRMKQYFQYVDFENLHRERDIVHFFQLRKYFKKTYDNEKSENAEIKNDDKNVESTPQVKSTDPDKTTELQKKVKQIKKPIDVNSSYDPLSNKGILAVSEKLLKKNFNLGEEGYDIARDEGRVKPSKDKKDGTTMTPSKEMEKTRKVNKGPSAYERVKKKYKGQIMDVDKKKKDKK